MANYFLALSCLLVILFPYEGSSLINDPPRLGSYCSSETWSDECRKIHPLALCDYKNHMCFCSNGFVAFENQCLQNTTELDVKCTSLFDCRNSYQTCNWNIGKCVCEQGRIAINDTCIRAATYGASCKTNQDCELTSLTHSCNYFTSTCQCKPGFEKLLGSTKCTAIIYRSTTMEDRVMTTTELPPCNNDAMCNSGDGSMYCDASIHYCRCNEARGYYFHNGLRKCIQRTRTTSTPTTITPKPSYHMPCNHNSMCDPGDGSMYCDASLRSCRCNEARGYYFHHGWPTCIQRTRTTPTPPPTTTRKPSYHMSCYYDTMCKSHPGDRSMYCSAVGVCQCNQAEGYYILNGWRECIQLPPTTSPKPSYHTHCNRDSMCKTHPWDRSMNCVSGYCKCYEMGGYYLDFLTGKCIYRETPTSRRPETTMKPYDKRGCYTRYECVQRHGIHSYCDPWDKTCRCTPTYRFDARTGKCSNHMKPVQDMSYYDLMQLPDFYQCGSDYQCSNFNREMICLEGECICKPGYFPNYHYPFCTRMLPEDANSILRKYLHSGSMQHNWFYLVSVPLLIFTLVVIICMIYEISKRRRNRQGRPERNDSSSNTSPPAYVKIISSNDDKQDDGNPTVKERLHTISKPVKSALKKLKHACRKDPGKIFYVNIPADPRKSLVTKTDKQEEPLVDENEALSPAEDEILNNRPAVLVLGTPEEEANNKA